MKLHTLFGAMLFGDRHSELDLAAAEIALNHHERWDGNGYPGKSFVLDEVKNMDMSVVVIRGPGKKGNEIPLFARIVSVADVYDALASRRCYKPAWDEREIVETMMGEAGKQFDPELIELFFSSFHEIKAIHQRFPD